MKRDKFAGQYLAENNVPHPQLDKREFVDWVANPDISRVAAILRLKQIQSIEATFSLDGLHGIDEFGCLH